MILKNLQQDSETLYERETIVEHEVEELIYDVLERSNWQIPDEFLDEVRKYAKRNAFAFDSYSIHQGENITIKACCKHCLKAYIIQKARELKINSESVSVIEEVFDCEGGHNGYYLE